MNDSLSVTGALGIWGTGQFQGLFRKITLEPLEDPGAKK